MSTHILNIFSVKYFLIVLFSGLFVSCKHPQQDIIDTIQHTHTYIGRSMPFYKCIRALDSQENTYFFQLNHNGQVLKGSLWLPQKKEFYFLQGIIDEKFNFKLVLQDEQKQIKDTLKGYFASDVMKALFTSQPNNLLLGGQVEGCLAMRAMGIGFQGKSESYAFEPKPSLSLLYHWSIPRDIQTHAVLYDTLCKLFIGKVVTETDSVRGIVIKEMLLHKQTFEKTMASIKKPTTALNYTAHKSFEIMYNEPPLISIWVNSTFRFRDSVFMQDVFLNYDYQQKRILLWEELPREVRNSPYIQSTDSITGYLKMPFGYQIFVKDFLGKRRQINLKE